MLHRLRAATGRGDNKYMLDGIIELDATFYKTYGDNAETEEQKRGTGSQTQSKVLAVSKVDPKRGRPKKHKNHLRFDMSEWS